MPAAHEAAVVLRPPGYQLVGQAQVVAQPDPARLAREKAVRRRLDDEAGDVLGSEFSAGRVLALDHDDLRPGIDRLEPARRSEPGDPTSDDDDPHAARDSSKVAACPRTSSASAAMNTGSSFNAGGRSSRTPRSAATAAALWSISKRIST